MSLPTPITYGVTSGDVGDHTHLAGQTLSLNVPDGALIEAGTLVGDANTLFDHAVGGNNILTSNAVLAVLIGDAVTITDHAQGGHNQITGAGTGPFIGDAWTMTGFARGGDNVVFAPGGGTLGTGSVAYGDAMVMNDHAQGGGNQVSATTASYGDADTMSGFATGGHNTVTALAGTEPVAYGDAGVLTDHAKGGNNLVIGPDGSQFPAQLYGDAYEVSGLAQGGNNTLIAGAATTYMYGDGFELLGHAKAGGNTLVAGSGADFMWGDATTVAPTAQTEPNTFVFSLDRIAAGSIGQDVVEDFRPGQDHIDLQGFGGVTNFSQLSGDVTETSQGSLITLGPSESILVLNDFHLTSGDFIFT